MQTKFEFEYPAIMEDNQSKQTERFSVMAKGSDYFFLLNDKCKPRYKVKKLIISTGMTLIR